jgi:hypothetical protein
MKEGKTTNKKKPTTKVAGLEISDGNRIFILSEQELSLAVLGKPLASKRPLRLCF